MVKKRNRTSSKTDQKKVSSIKHKSGAGLKNTFKSIIAHTKRHLKKLKPKCKKVILEMAIAAAKELTSDLPVQVPRVIPVPKTGGFLPLVTIFAGLSASGSLAGGIAGITKTINDYKAAKKRLTELERHNKQMEAVCIGKGLHLKPYKDGLGIYVTKKKN